MELTDVIANIQKGCKLEDSEITVLQESRGVTVVTEVQIMSSQVSVSLLVNEIEYTYILNRATELSNGSNGNGDKIT